MYICFSIPTVSDLIRQQIHRLIYVFACCVLRKSTQEPSVINFNHIKNIMYRSQSVLYCECRCRDMIQHCACAKQSILSVKMLLQHGNTASALYSKSCNVCWDCVLDKATTHSVGTVVGPIEFQMLCDREQVSETVCVLYECGFDMCANSQKVKILQVMLNVQYRGCSMFFGFSL